MATMKPREDFTSICGSSIYLGHYKNKLSSHLDFKPTLTMHATVSQRDQQTQFPKGLAHGKFGDGFNRRRESVIRAGIDEENRRLYSARDAQKAEKHQNTSKLRLQMMKDVNNRSGYNIINGCEVDVSTKPRPSTTSIRMVGGDGLGPEAPTRGISILRESEGRSFTPVASGHNADYRQDVLVREGILTPRCSSVIQLGHKDLVSYGMEDQLSKSCYAPLPETAQRGLVETRQPGRYTPRQVPGHPAADPSIVKRWTTDADLNNRTVNKQLQKQQLQQQQPSTRPW